MTALGRELWVAGDELLAVAARVPLGRALANSGISLRNAADLLLDGDWESVQGELETASVSCENFLPEECFRGLVDLFGYDQPVPVCEWANAAASLRVLGDQMEASALDILRGANGESRQEAEGSLMVVCERLRKASELFQPGGFYMPADPRDDTRRAGRGAPRNPEPRPFGNEDRSARAVRLREENLRGEALLAATAAGQEAVALVETVVRTIQAASDRRAVLRKLVLELHPDQNVGRQKQVLPAFYYVQQLRNGEK